MIDTGFDELPRGDRLVAAGIIRHCQHRLSWRVRRCAVDWCVALPTDIRLLTLVDDSVTTVDGAQSVDHDGRRHRVELGVQRGYLRPVGHDEGGDGAVERGRWTRFVVHIGEALAHVLDCHVRTASTTPCTSPCET